ncbi:MAG: MATE family efflux transporter [Oscillospiraceae bacterium]|nr:MATE family efflux transporter [Oscillospiraceae bacterium]
MKRTNDLGKDSILSLVLRLAVPAMLAQLVNVLYTAIDRMFIGNIPVIGDVALAGIGVCAPIAEFIASWGNLIGIGGSVYMAIKMGEKDNEKASRILSTCFQSLIVLSVILAVVFMLAKGRLITWFGASSETFGYADEYLTIYIIGSIFAVMTIGMNYFITCQGFAGTAMFSVIIGALVNILLDYVFVFLMNMQVAGAALATVIAQACSCTWTMLFLFGKKVHIKVKLYSISSQIVRKVCRLGFPAFIMYSTNSVIVIILNIVLQKYGGEAMGDKLISASAIVQSYVLAILNPLGGITAGTSAVVSYNYGARDYKRVIKAYNVITGAAVVFCAVMFVVSRIVPHHIAMIFTQDAEIAALAEWGMKAYTFGLVPLAMHYAATDCLTAMGRAGTALFMSAFRKISFVVLVCVIPLFAAPEMTFISQSLSDGICGLINTAACIVIVKRIINSEKEKYGIV